MRDQISNELMTIRFTARTVERLSDSVRSLVDEIRRHERAIHDILRRQGAACRARTSSRSSPAPRARSAG